MIAYAATTAVNNISEGTTSELAGLIETIITKIPLWIAAFIVILMSIFLAKIVKSIVENKMAEKGIEDEHKEVQALGGRIAYMVVLTIGMTVGLKIAGIDLTTIIAAVGFGIGFALKDLIMNFIAGVMIIVGRHFMVGDFINIGGTIGKVMEIQSRVTVLRGIDGTKVIVPNSKLFGNTVTSYTSNPFRRIEIIVGVDYGTNLENAVKVCMHAIKVTKKILVEPKPYILINEFADSSINLKIRVWVESRSAWLKTKSNLVLNIKKAFDEYNINIPWPITQFAQYKDPKPGELMFKESKVETAKIAPAVDVKVSALNQSQPEQSQVQITSAGPVLQTVKVEADVEDKPLKPLGEIR